MTEFWKEPVNEFGIAHRAFLQLVLKKNLILQEDVVPSFLKFYSRYNNNEDVLLPALDATQNRQIVNELLECLNNHLRHAGMRILQVPDEARRNTEYVTIVSDRAYSEVMLQASGFSTDELAKFQVWLKMMYFPDAAINGDDNSVNDEISQGEVPIERMLNSRVGNLSASGVQKLLNKFIAAQWLIMDNIRNVIRLHPKAIAELSNGLQMEFQLPSCALCRRGVFLRRLSYSCECEFFYHTYCIIKANITTTAKCVNRECGRDLTEDVV